MVGACSDCRRVLLSCCLRGFVLSMVGSSRISLVFPLIVGRIMAYSCGQFGAVLRYQQFSLAACRLFRDSCLQLERCALSSAAAACSLQALQG